MEQQCKTLLFVTIPSWYQQRGSGRWKGVDTARKQCIESRVQPDLRFGKMPSDDDVKALFTLGKFDTLSTADQKWLVEWRKKNFPDGRQKKRPVDGLQQTDLFRYFVRAK